MEIYLVGSIVALMMLAVSYNVDTEAKEHNIFIRATVEIALSWFGAITTTLRLIAINKKMRG